VARARIGIDAGHGGKSPGAVGPTGLKEKDVNLAVAKELRDLLFWMGYEAVMSREDDRTRGLAWRCSLFNKEKVDLVLSIHCNAADNKEASYIATFVYSDRSPAVKFAQNIVDRLSIVMNWPNGGVRVRNFQILRDTKAPAVLVEMGFISNPEQEKILADAKWQELLANAIAHAVHYCLQPPSPPPKPKEEDEKAENVAPWAADAVKKAVLRGITDGKDLTRTEQRVLVWLDRLNLLGGS